MPKKIFVFDIDETLLSDVGLFKDLHQIDQPLNEVKKDHATFNPYDVLSNPYRSMSDVVVINKEKIAEIMRGILANGDEVAFVTAGSISKENMRKFCQQEYGISLPDHFYFYNDRNKTPRLKEIALYRGVPHQDVILIDNAKNHISDAEQSGFSVIRADTNNISSHPNYGVDQTNGELYIQQLETIVAEQARARAIESLQKIGIKSNAIDGNFKLQDAVNNIAATGDFSRDDWKTIQGDTLLQTAVNNIAATGDFSRDDWRKITAEEPTRARNQFQNSVTALRNLDANKPDTRQKAIDVYASKTFTNFAKNVSGKIDDESFKAALDSTQKECTKTLDDSLSRTLLKGITNFLSHVSLVGMIGNAVHKYKTGNWLFYEHTSERQQMKEASQSLVIGG